MNRAYPNRSTLTLVASIVLGLTSLTGVSKAADPVAPPATPPVAPKPGAGTQTAPKSPAPAPAPASSAPASSAPASSAPASSAPANPAPPKPASTAPANPAPANPAPPKPASTSPAPASETPTGAPAPAATEAPAPEEGTAATPARPSAEKIEAAKKAFAEGELALQASDFALAEERFRSANELIPTPHAEYWIAYAMDKQGKPNKEVYAAYELFLSHPAAAHVGQEELSAAESRRAALKATLPASVIVETTPAGAQVKVDGVVVPGVTPLEVDMDKGTHRIELTLAGYDSAVVELDAEAGTRVRAPVDLQKTKVEVPVRPEEVATKKRNIVPGIVTLGLGGAGLITGTVFGILALDSKSQFEDRPSAAKADETERNALIADMSFGIALTLGITGVVLLTTDDDAVNPAQTAQAAKKVRFSPFASPLGGGATLSGAF